MRTALVIHLFYEKIALEIIDYIGRLSSSHDLFLTGAAVQTDRVRTALESLPNRQHIMEAGGGRDVGPFLKVLPSLIEQNYDFFCKLHTKAGGSGYAREWLHAYLEALIGSDERVRRILEAFYKDNSLCHVGPKSLYVSAKLHTGENAQNLRTVARVCFPGSRLPPDWGFFAGTMFWGRTDQFRPLLSLARYGLDFKNATRSADGELEHAVERAFGLLAALNGTRIGLIGSDGEVVTADASSAMSQQTLIECLAALRYAQLSGNPLPASKDLDNLQNPLLHYLTSGADGAFDPNPYFHSAWYARENPSVSRAYPTGLQHFASVGAREGQDPSPLFNTRYYFSVHPELAVRGENPLSNFLLQGSRLGYRARPARRIQSVTQTWLNPTALRRTVHPAQERAFLEMLAPAAEVRKTSREVLVSVVMPAVANVSWPTSAVDSVLHQSHQNFELVIVRGKRRGSKDRPTCSQDPRIKVVAAPQPNAASARSAGLAAATGSIVAYLDPQCTWRPRFLETMTTWMMLRNLPCAYALSEIRSGGSVIGYRGEQFDLASCEQGGCIDLNTLCHLRSLCNEHGGFEGGATNFALRISRADDIGFATIVGCVYNELSVAIKVDSDSVAHQRLGSQLAKTLRKLGLSVRLDGRREWYSHDVPPNEIAIALRGPQPYEPQHGQFSALWAVDVGKVSAQELAGFGLIVVNAENDAVFVRATAPTPSRIISLGPIPDVASAAAPNSDPEWFIGCAQTILENVRARFGCTEGPSTLEEKKFPHTPTLRSRARIRVHVVRRADLNATQSSFFIRLLSPLTSQAASDIQLTLGDENSVDGPDSDVCIVCRDAYDDLDAISSLIERTRRTGTRVVVDNDDAFALLDPKDPYADILSLRNDRMKVLMESADQCWFSTSRLAEEYRQNWASCQILRNTLDPRIWGSSRPRFHFPSNDRARFLYMGTARHFGDLALLLPALDALAQTAPGAFEVTVIGVAGGIPPRPWLHRLPIPSSARIYPNFIRWLLRQGPFDIGLAPLERTPFNDCKSDIKFLDYSAMGLVSIVSDVPAYVDIAKLRGLAIVVENNAEAWTSALFQALDRRTSHREMAIAANRYVWDERSVHATAETQLALIEAR